MTAMRITSVKLEQPGGKYAMRVTGTADANAFAKAWIEIGAGENPTQWQKVVDDIKAPVRAYLPDLLKLVLEGRINPGLVFDSTLPLDEVAEGYRAMDERRSVKVLLQPH